MRLQNKIMLNIKIIDITEGIDLYCRQKNNLYFIIENLNLLSYQILFTNHKKIRRFAALVDLFI